MNNRKRKFALRDIIGASLDLDISIIPQVRVVIGNLVYHTNGIDKGENIWDTLKTGL